MNIKVSITRIAILTILGIFAMALILGTETSENATAWTLQVIIDKGLGVAACFAVGRLYRRWRRADPWIKAYDRFCKEVDKAPNPSQL